jgi:hypothetical protein
MSGIDINPSRFPREALHELQLGVSGSKNGTYKAGLLICLRRCPCGRQHLRLVTVRVLYPMFVRLAGWMAGQGFPMSRVDGRAGARVGAGWDFGIHSA